MYISANHECVETLLFFMLQLHVSLYSIFNLMLWCYVWGLVRFWHKNTWLQLRKVFWLKISVLVATNYKLSMISKISSGFTHPNIKPVFTCSHWLGSHLACKSNTLWYIINNTQNTQKKCHYGKCDSYERESKIKLQFMPTFYPVDYGWIPDPGLFRVLTELCC